MAEAKYPPYVNAYGNISNLLKKIRTASVPPKVTQDYLSTVLGLKSSSYQPMIPFLKRLGFLDQSNIPTQRYKDFRSDQKSGFVMAKAIKEAYPDLYQANEYAHKLPKNDLMDIIITKTGASKDDKAVMAAASSFMELTKYASFDIADIPEEIGSDSDTPTVEPEVPIIKTGTVPNLGLSYTINLNLPATTDPKVFDAIFQSLKRHIIG